MGTRHNRRFRFAGRAADQTLMAGKMLLIEDEPSNSPLIEVTLRPLAFEP